MEEGMNRKHQVSKKLVLAVALSVAALAPLHAFAANKLIVKDAAGTTDKFVVTDGGYVGIGTNAPTNPINVKAGGTSGATTLFLHNTGNSPTNRYDSPGMVFFRNNISSVNDGLPQNADRLGFFSFGATAGGGNRYSAAVSSYADGIWTTTAYPSYLTFETTTPPTTYATEKMRVTSSGNIGIGATAPAQKLEVNGGVRLNTGTAKPACDANSRGTLWFAKGGTGVADTMEVCAKQADENYVWKALF